MSELEATAVGLALAGSAVLDGISVRFPAARFTALIGPNGSGKSSLLRVLAGLRAPDRGRISLSGTDLATFSRAALAREITFMPQDTRVPEGFTVREVVAMGRYPHRGRFSRATPRDRAVVDCALERVEAETLAERPASELSGGERQRVLVARSLATEAPIMLLDEATASLDVAHVLDVMALCESLVAEGKTIVMAQHDLNGALRWAKHAVLLDGGRIAGAGPPHDVLTADVYHDVFGVAVGTRSALAFDRSTRLTRSRAPALDVTRSP